MSKTIKISIAVISVIVILVAAFFFFQFKVRSIIEKNISEVGASLKSDLKYDGIEIKGLFVPKEVRLINLKVISHNKIITSNAKDAIVTWKDKNSLDIKLTNPELVLQDVNEASQTASSTIISSREAVVISAINNQNTKLQIFFPKSILIKNALYDYDMSIDFLESNPLIKINLNDKNSISYVNYEDQGYKVINGKTGDVLGEASSSKVIFENVLEGQEQIVNFLLESNNNKVSLDRLLSDNTVTDDLIKKEMSEESMDNASVEEQKIIDEDKIEDTRPQIEAIDAEIENELAETMVDALDEAVMSNEDSDQNQEQNSNQLKAQDSNQKEKILDFSMVVKVKYIDSKSINNTKLIIEKFNLSFKEKEFLLKADITNDDKDFIPYGNANAVIPGYRSVIPVIVQGMKIDEEFMNMVFGNKKENMQVDDQLLEQYLNNFLLKINKSPEEGVLSLNIVRNAEEDIFINDFSSSAIKQIFDESFYISEEADLDVMH